MRACCVFLALVPGAVLAHGQEKQAPRYTEQIDVERVLVDVRVLGSISPTIAKPSGAC